SKRSAGFQHIVSCLPNYVLTCWAGRVFSFRTGVASNRYRLYRVPEVKHTTLVLAARREPAMVAEGDGWSSWMRRQKRSLCSAMRLSLLWFWRCCPTVNSRDGRRRSPRASTRSPTPSALPFRLPPCSIGCCAIAAVAFLPWLRNCDAIAGNRVSFHHSLPS